MLTARYGTRLATPSSRARDLFETATYQILAHKPGVDARLGEAAVADPSCAGVWALRGLCQILLAREATVERARHDLNAALAACELAPASEDESALVEALQVAIHGGLRRAAGILEARIEDEPGLVLFAKLAHALRFMGGDIERLTLGVERALLDLSPAAEGRGYLVGCLAFGAEEKGAYARAEALALEALHLQPDDAWAMHALTHIHEMTGRYDDGLRFIEAQRAVWQNCNNFALHMSWHAALFHLERDDADTAMRIFDDEVWPRASEDFRDISNAVSLLQRLESRGVPVGSRWRSVAEAAALHVHDRTYAFACLHHLIALLAAGRRADACILLDAMERPSGPRNDQEQVLRRFARPLARLLVHSAQHPSSVGDCSALLGAIQSLGGSTVQRDLFVQILGDEASRTGDGATLRSVLDFRSRLKAEDQFDRRARSRLDRYLAITA